MQLSGEEKNIYDNDDLLKQYRRYAKEHGASTEDGDHIIANKAHDGIVLVLKQMMAVNKVDDLCEFLRDPDDWVRLWAATHTLKVKEKAALKVLKQLSKKDGLVGFDAENVINEWEEGNLSSC